MIEGSGFGGPKSYGPDGSGFGSATLENILILGFVHKNGLIISVPNR
jgi:hypothetical protein